MTEEMDAGRIRMTVTPEPTDEELAAVAAVVTAVAASSSREAASAERGDDVWRRIGRHETLRATTWPPQLDSDGTL